MRNLLRRPTVFTSPPGPLSKKEGEPTASKPASKQSSGSPLFFGEGGWGGEVHGRWGRVLALLLLAAAPAAAQQKALVNTSASTHAKLQSVDMGSVQWTTGFWAERFEVCQKSMIPTMWALYHSDRNHAFKNFEIAAGQAQGEHAGPPFHDGDFYKLLEALSASYAVTHDPKLDKQLDEAIAVVAKCQRADGYIHTPTSIAQRNHPGQTQAFADRLHFETYNLGHLMTAGCVHYRATGKTTLLAVAKKATDYLYTFYKTASPELARNAICPSHYMGVVEMYRTTRDPRYLELAQSLLNIRGLVESGTDDNQDRIPFRQMQQAGGHAVRANYLFAGAADVYAETGDPTLLSTLNKMWDDVTQHKLYVTGACGALYDGVSPDGTAYKPDTVQKIHQAYGRDYQLPNHTAHGETCANIGNVLWNWRMLQITADAKYADVLEMALYNSVLSGISLDGQRFLYTNPLAYSTALPFSQRWSKERVDYISLSNCCPPNVVRTISEVNNYLYSVSGKGLYLNLYGGNNLNTKLTDGSPVKLTQATSYPWDGAVNLTLQQVPKRAFSLFLRVPGWCAGAALRVNGQPVAAALTPGQYAEVRRAWKAGDKVELTLPMPAQLVEANPLVEETRNQVAVRRGPVVYCLEANDLPAGKSLSGLLVAASTTLTPHHTTIAGSDVVWLEGQSEFVDNSAYAGQLYHPISKEKPATVPFKLIPYYAWGNRGLHDMEVWLPLGR